MLLDVSYQYIVVVRFCDMELFSDIRRLKETRRHFEKISADMDSALVRNAQAPRSKVQECDDAHNYLTAMTSGFYHTALDYVFQVFL